MSENYVNQITSTSGTTYDIAEGMTTRIFRGTCSTAANTSPKVVALDDATGFSLTTGVRVAVTFTHGNNIDTASLNVEGTGAKSIVLSTNFNTYTQGSGTTYNAWGGGETVIFTYNGNYWVNSGSGLGIYRAYALANSKGSGTVTSIGITNGGGLSISNSPVTDSGTITVGHSNSTITAKTTQAVYPIKFDTYGHITGSGNAVTIPSKTSDLTNDSGFITSADVPTVPTNVSAFTNDAGYITSYTDTKVAISAATLGTDYYLIMGTGTTAAERQYDIGLYYNVATTTNRYSTLVLGNSTATTNTTGRQGRLQIFGSGSYYAYILANSAQSNTISISLPSSGGTLALTSDIPTVPTITLNGSSTTSPSFYAPTSGGTSGYYLKSNGNSAPSWTSFPTIPSITLNGSSTTSPSFYAPTGAGTSGYYLKSNGSGAPSWTAFPTIPSISLNGSSTTSLSFYAPTTAGTSGYYLKSNGSGAPSWTVFPTIPSKVSDLTNDSDYMTSSELGDLLADVIPEITPSLSSGTAIATITTGETTQTLYAPSGGGGSSSAVIVSEEYTFSFNFDAGTIGTRGYQGSQTITKTGYTPISVVVTYVGSSTSYFPVAFLGSYGTTLYCNAYRATSSAVSNSSVKVTVYYALDDGNAVSVNTYNGEVS